MKIVSIQASIKKENMSSLLDGTISFLTLFFTDIKHFWKHNKCFQKQTISIVTFTSITCNERMPNNVRFSK